VNIPNNNSAGSIEPQADRAVAASLGLFNRLDKLNATKSLSEALQLRISMDIMFA
jgi:hypothetical protein